MFQTSLSLFFINSHDTWFLTVLNLWYFFSEFQVFSKLLNYSPQDLRQIWTETQTDLDLLRQSGWSSLVWRLNVVNYYRKLLHLKRYVDPRYASKYACQLTSNINYCALTLIISYFYILFVSKTTRKKSKRSFSGKLEKI